MPAKPCGWREEQVPERRPGNLVYICISFVACTPRARPESPHALPCSARSSILLANPTFYSYGTTKCGGPGVHPTKTPPFKLTQLALATFQPATTKGEACMKACTSVAMDDNPSSLTEVDSSDRPPPAPASRSHPVRRNPKRKAYHIDRFDASSTIASSSSSSDVLMTSRPLDAEVVGGSQRSQPVDQPSSSVDPDNTVPSDATSMRPTSAHDHLEAIAGRPPAPAHVSGPQASSSSGSQTKKRSRRSSIDSTRAATVLSPPPASSTSSAGPPASFALLLPPLASAAFPFAGQPIAELPTSFSLDQPERDEVIGNGHAIHDNDRKYSASGDSRAHSSRSGFASHSRSRRANTSPPASLTSSSSSSSSGSNHAPTTSSSGGDGESPSDGEEGAVTSSTSLNSLSCADSTTSSGCSSSGTSSSTSSSSSSTTAKRAPDAAGVMSTRLKKRKLSHRIRSILILRPPGLPAPGTDGEADIHHIMKAPAWLKNATSELSRESRMMPVEWSWSEDSIDRNLDNWTVTSMERDFSRLCRINVGVVQGDVHRDSPMSNQVLPHSVQLSLDRATDLADSGSLRPLGDDGHAAGASTHRQKDFVRARRTSAPPVMHSDEESRSQTLLSTSDGHSSTSAPSSPRLHAISLPSLDDPRAHPLPPSAVPQQLLKAQLLAVLRTRLGAGAKPGDAPLRMKKFVVWNGE